MKRKILLFSMLTIALCLSLICGATYALFTSESKVNIAVSSGKVEMVASVENVETWSLEDDKTIAGRTDGSFTQGGSVALVDGKLVIDKIIPGDKVSFEIAGTNNSNITIQYRVIIKALSGLELVDGLNINIANVEYKKLSSYTTAWELLTAGNNMDKIEVSIELPQEAGNQYQDLKAEFLVKVEAVQGNADPEGEFEVVTFELWDGAKDDTGLEDNTDATAKVLKIESASQLAAFAAAVNAGNSYAGYTVTLEKDIYLNNQAWTPIGPNADANNKFKGTFDGQGHTIYDLYVEQGAAYHAAGLFGALNGTIKNLVIDGAKVSSISSGAATDNGTAIVAGSIYVKGSIDNVTVRNAEVVGNRYVGVIAGYAYGNITNCVVEYSKVTANMDDLTGTLDNGDKVGAIVGYLGGESTYKLSNNVVDHCELVGARDLGGIAGVISGPLAEFENNKVSNTNITYSLEKSYVVAGEIVSQRTTIAVPASNTFENVTIIKNN